MERSSATPHVRATPPGPQSRKWIAYHRAAAARATYVEGFVWDRAAPAAGPFCTDPDGNIFLDFASHVGTSPLGYNHPELLAVSDRLKSIDPDRYAGTDFISAYGRDPQQIEIPTPSHLHHKLLEITGPFAFGTAFFSNSGAEAVENAIKICYDARRNCGYGFCFLGAFHGRTLGALSLNRSKRLHRSWYPQIPNIVHLPYCICGEECRCGFWLGPVGSESRLAHFLDPIRGLIDPAEVAYIIIEPIQGEGGYHVPNAAFMAEVGRVARQHQIPLIADEIQSGMGRTGQWWGSEHFEIRPDIIVAGKALRVGATIGRAELFPKEEMRLGSTWGEGNALSSAIGFTTIEVIQREGLLEHATRMGERLRHELRNLQRRFDFILDVRGLGLMDAMELDTVERRGRILQACLERGLLLLGCGFKAIRFLPPLDVTQRELDLALEILSGVLSAE
ncbi:MAG TPA: aminotransferase class III-fold pyridoxal phosphate-dependent enzyme [archaeon]|nr:aminotransferase class III-fold pyridoxal phosphate-dependent enzyme [archaeon]